MRPLEGTEGRIICFRLTLHAPRRIASHIYTYRVLIQNASRRCLYPSGEGRAFRVLSFSQFSHKESSILSINARKHWHIDRCYIMLRLIAKADSGVPQWLYFGLMKLYKSRICSSSLKGMNSCMLVFAERIPQPDVHRLYNCKGATTTRVRFPVVVVSKI